MLLPAAACPAWAQTPAPAGQVEGMDAMPDIGIDWPDLSTDAPPIATVEVDAPPPETEQTPEEAPPQAQTAADDDDPDDMPAAEEGGDQALIASLDPAEALRYDWRIEGLGDAGDAMLHERFDALSALRAGQGSSANVAQIRRRGRADTELLDSLLHVRGYYDSRTRLDFRRSSGAAALSAILAANPGAPYLIDRLDIDGLSTDEPGLENIRALFTVKQGDRADTDQIFAATDALRAGLLNGGYPFSQVRDPVLVVDHGQHTAALNMTVNTGGFRRFGDIMVNADAPFDARHVAVIGRFSPGEPFEQDKVADLNRALVATGLVSQVTITPTQGAAEDAVDLDIRLTQAPLRTIAGEIGYGTGEGARLALSWQHRNFVRPEGALTVRGVLAEQEQSLTARLRRANFGARDRVLNAEVSYARLNQPAYQARTAGISGSLERQTNLIFQKDWTWSLGAELLLSNERDFFAFDSEGNPRRTRERTFVIAALPTSLNYDDSDDLLDPRKGFRLGGRFSPELSLQGSVFGYARLQVDGSYYLPMGDRLTLAGRVRLGTIMGSSRDRIAPTRRFYAGGGASVRGYSYQAIGPRDANNAPLGGRSLGEFSLEARFRFGSENQFGLVPFVDAGTISPEPWPSIREMRVGAGMGFRYYSNFGPIRVDVGTPINPQPGDARIGVYVSLGQAF